MIRIACTAAGVALALSLAPAPASAAQEHLETLRAECGKQLNLSEPGCNCISEMAARELNEKQQEFVAAMVVKDDARTTDLRGGMTIDEMTGAASFMMRAPQACGGK
jgi:hypothetical protein